MKSGRINVTHGLSGFLWFFSLLDEGDTNFPIVTPRVPSFPEMPANNQDEPLAKDDIQDRIFRLMQPMLRGC